VKPPEPINILQLICPAGIYGAELWVLALANNSDPVQVGCHLAVTDEGSTSDEMIAMYPPNAGQTFKLEMKHRFDLRAIVEIRKLVRRNNIHVLHSHGYKSDILALVCSKLVGIPCISTPHGFGQASDLKLKLFHWLGKQSLRWFDAVVPLSEALYEQLAGWIQTTKLQLIRNGVDLKQLDQIVAETTTSKVQIDHAPVKPARVGYIGRLAAGKQVDHVIECFASLHSQGLASELIIIGEGPDRIQLQQVAKSLGCAGDIKFLGFRQDRLEFLKHFDLFLMASVSEGIPRNLMEALATKVPVVAYDIPGVDQLIKHEKTGLLATLNDKAALTAHSVRLIKNRHGIRDTVIENGRALIEQEYSAAKMAHDYQILFNQVLAIGQKEAGLSANKHQPN